VRKSLITAIGFAALFIIVFYLSKDQNSFSAASVFNEKENKTETKKTRTTTSFIKKIKVNLSQECQSLSSEDIKKEILKVFNTAPKVQVQEDITHVEKRDGSTHIVKFSLDPRGRKMLTHFIMSEDGFPVAQELSNAQKYTPKMKFINSLLDGIKVLKLMKNTYELDSMSFYLEEENQRVKYMSLSKGDILKACKNLKNNSKILACACR